MIDQNLYMSSLLPVEIKKKIYLKKNIELSQDEKTELKKT